jgi:hypothetical protein
VATGTIVDNDAPISGDLNTEVGLFVPAGNDILLTLSGGAGGHGYAAGAYGGRGGIATFELVPARNTYLRSRIGKQGASGANASSPLADPNGGGATSSDGQGGGASAIAVSADGVTWVPVAIVGGGGGGGYKVSSIGGHGGGLNQNGMSGSPHSTSSSYVDSAGKGAGVGSSGTGGIRSSYIGGTGGGPGFNGETADALGGAGDPLFGVGGGGGGNDAHSGGGGGGRYGGGGSAYAAGGGGGSGYWDEAGWLQVAGVVPTIISNQTGGNAGDGLVTVEKQYPVVFSVAEVMGEEGQTLDFAITAAGTSDEPIAISYSASGGTAVVGEDYEALSGMLTFAPGDTSKTISLVTIEDSIFEGLETLDLTFTVDSGEASPKPFTAKGVITDNDLPNTSVGAPLSADGMLILPGSTVAISMAAGAGGDGRVAAAAPRGKGGKASFSVSAAQAFYIRSRVGKQGASKAGEQVQLRDLNGGGATNGGQGGGASAIAISSDGYNWIPVAIVGGGGGGGHQNGASGGAGGGLNLNGTNGVHYSSFLDAYGRGGLVDAIGAAGVASIHGDGGDGGAPGLDGQSSDSEGGVGDVVFGIGGGGGSNNNYSGGGGGGRYGGGGSAYGGGGGGGSGYWDAESWQSIVGAVPTISSTQTGANAGDGSVTITVSP